MIPVIGKRSAKMSGIHKNELIILKMCEEESKHITLVESFKEILKTKWNIKIIVCLLFTTIFHIEGSQYQVK